ncbi:hypothetical protein GF327_04890 [Candidatus Woesearchaeota archaeon]|nr:hypothetical protein [Candidatus Woesearchaeota archaeon]
MPYLKTDNLNTVYAVDLSYHGKTKVNSKCNLKDFSKITGLFVKKLNIVDPVICAHSAGALVAIDYAQNYPVKELVLIQPGGLNYYNSAAYFLFKLIFLKSLYNHFRYPLQILYQI